MLIGSWVQTLCCPAKQVLTLQEWWLHLSAKERTRCSLQWVAFGDCCHFCHGLERRMIPKAKLGMVCPVVRECVIGTLKLSVPKKPHWHMDVLYHVIYMCLHWSLLLSVIPGKAVTVCVRLLSTSTDHLDAALIRTLLYPYCCLLPQWSLGL